MSAALERRQSITNASRTNGAAGVIPATLKYVTEFISQNAHRE